MKKNTLAAFILTVFISAFGASFANAQCSGSGGVPFNCTAGLSPQSADLVLGGSNSSPQTGQTVKYTVGQLETYIAGVLASSFSSSNVNISGGSITNTPISGSTGAFTTLSASGLTTIGANSYEQEVSGELWITTNAVWNSTTSQWNRVNTAQYAFALQMGPNNLLSEGAPGVASWICAPGANPISSTFGAVGGWQINWVSVYRNFVVGGQGIELDGSGTVNSSGQNLFGRFVQNGSGTAINTGIVSNIFDDYSGTDAAASPSWFMGFVGDQFVVKRAPAGSTTLTPMISVDAYGDLAVAGNAVVTGSLTVGGFAFTPAGAFSTSGAYSINLTATGATSITLPTTGTLATLAGSENLSNKTLTSPVVTGTATLSNTSMTGSYTTTNPVYSSTILYPSTTSLPAVNRHASTYGTLTSGTAGVYSWSVDTDRTAAAGAGGLNEFNFSAGFGGGATSVLTGGRNGLVGNLTMAGDTSTGSGAAYYYVAGTNFMRTDYWNGGYAGAEAGADFGRNDSCRQKNLGSIGSFAYRGCVGNETDVGIANPNLGVVGFSAVQWADAVANGWLIDSGYSIAKQLGGTAPGFKKLYSVGSPYGWWPGMTTGEIFGNYNTVAASSGPTATVANGFDLLNTTISNDSWIQTGAAISGTGNIGGQTVGGVTLSTLSSIVAETATVSTISPIDGGEFLAIPTLTLTAPPSGTTATASVATLGVHRVTSLVGGRGTGYVKGDILTLVGGTGTAATLTVAAVDTTGEIIDFTVTTSGSYSVLPSAPVSVTGGTGTGASLTAVGWTISTVTVTNVGSGYAQFPPPLVTTSGATKNVEPLWSVVMAATQTTLALNPGGATSATTLSVSGAATLSSTLSVAGTVTPLGALHGQGHGNFSLGFSPTVAANACGSTTQGTVSGTDQSFQLTVGTASVTSCAVTFGTTFATAPTCVFSPLNATAAAQATTVAYISALTTSAMTLTGAALASAKYTVHCM